MVVSGAKGAGTRASATVTVITQILMISNDVAPTYGFSRWMCGGSMGAGGD